MFRKNFFMAPDGAGGGAPAPTPDGAGGGAPKFSTVIPQEFHDRAYLKDFMDKPVAPDTYKELFKKLDGAESLIGKKTIGIPEATASDEEWNSFYAKIRPDSAEKYEIQVGEGQKADPNVAKALQGLFHKTGLSPRQAKALQEGYTGIIAEQIKAVQQTSAAKEVEFAKLTEATFGADREKVLARTKQMLTEFAPEKIKDFAGDIDNKSLVLLAAVLNGVHAKYRSEDGGPGKGAGTAVKSEGELREELRSVIGSSDFGNVLSANHEVAKAKARELSVKIAGLGSK